MALATADTPTGKPTWTEFSGCQSAAPVLQNAASAGTWVKANAGQYGFFRVQYDEALWARLVAAAPTLPPTDLAGLLEDSWALAEAGELGIDTFLNLVGCAPFQGRAREGGWVCREGDRGWLGCVGKSDESHPRAATVPLPTGALGTRGGFLGEAHSLSSVLQALGVPPLDDPTATPPPFNPPTRPSSSLAARSPEDYEPWAAALPYLERVAQLAPCSTLWQNYLAQTLFNTFLRQDAGGQANTSTAPPPLAFSFDAPSPEGAGVGQRLLRPAILAAAGRYGHLAITVRWDRVKERGATPPARHASRTGMQAPSPSDVSRTMHPFPPLASISRPRRWSWCPT